jgi:uncharacterized protein DUF6600
MAFRESFHERRGAIMAKRAGRFILLVVILLMTGAWSSPARAEVSFDFFYSNLTPHGAWQVSARYGRVWQPRVYNADWNPYYDGHWTYTDVGWTWVSDYEWGAIPYHYGTWVVDPEIGWVWVPGYVWAPSWVVFRTGPDYIGWAPVSPGFSIGVSTGFVGRAGGPFVFVSARDFVAPRVRACVVPEVRARLVLNNTRVVNTLVVERNVVVNRGPDVRVVERASGRTIRKVPLEQVPRFAPGRGVTRDQIALDVRNAKRGVRAAEPVVPSRPLPAAGPRATREATRHPEASARPRRERPAPRPPAHERFEAPTGHPQGPPVRGDERQARGQAQAPRPPHGGKPHP